VPLIPKDSLIEKGKEENQWEPTTPGSPENGCEMEVSVLIYNVPQKHEKFASTTTITTVYGSWTVSGTTWVSNR